MAERLADDHPAELARQLAWLSDRAPDNPAGMLRRAVEGRWSEPPAAAERRLRALRECEQREQAEVREEARRQSETSESEAAARKALDDGWATLEAAGARVPAGRRRAG